MKKAKIIVFLLIILTSILPLAGVIIPMLMGISPSSASTVGIIGSADGPTAILISAEGAPPRIFATFIPAGVLLILWLILHIKKRKNN